MEYVKDWDKIKERFNGFWANEIVDRCCISITAHKDKRTHYKFDNVDILEYYTEPELVFKRSEAAFSNTFYEGEAFPKIHTNLGSCCIAAYLGSKVILQEETIWFDPFIDDWSGDSYEMNWNSKWWKTTKYLTEELVKLSKGKYGVSIADIGAASDIMSHMRTPEKLLMDIYDYPNEIKKARDYITDIIDECYDKLYLITKENNSGSMLWLNLWAPEKHYTLQSDLSVMLSSQKFEEFFLPEIVNQCKNYKYPIYHLDGPGQIPHLDMFLEIPELRAIQWVPLPGQGSVKEWMWLYKRIQKANKGIYFAINSSYKTSAKDVEYVLQELSPEGLFMDVNCESQQEGEWLIKQMDKWSCKNKYR